MDERYLPGIYAKLARADKHLETLDGELATFAEEDPYGLRGEVDSKRSLYILRFVLKKQIPIGPSLTVGDFAHNLRSALDHLACALVPRPTRRTAWPVYDDADDFFCSVRVPAKHKRGPLAGLDPEGPVFAFIEQAQPYHRGEADGRDPLRLLADLNNEDKHRGILAMTMALAQEPTPHAEIVHLRDVEPAEGYTVYTNRPLKHDAKVLSSEIQITGPNPEMEMRCALTFNVAFGKTSPLAAKHLHSLREAVANGVVFLRELSRQGRKRRSA